MANRASAVIERAREAAWEVAEGATAPSIANVRRYRAAGDAAMRVLLTELRDAEQAKGDEYGGYPEANAEIFAHRDVAEMLDDLLRELDDGE